MARDHAHAKICTHHAFDKHGILLVCLPTSLSLARAVSCIHAHISAYAKQYCEAISDDKVFVSTQKRDSEEEIVYMGHGWTTIEEVFLLCAYKYICMHACMHV